MKFRFVKDSATARKMFEKLFGPIDPSKWDHSKSSILDAVGVDEKNLEKAVKAIIPEEALNQSKVTETVQVIMESLAQAPEKDAQEIVKLALVHGLQQIAGYRHELRMREMMGKGGLPAGIPPELLALLGGMKEHDADTPGTDDWEDLLGDDE